MTKSLILILLTALVFNSCSDNSTDPKNEEIFGTYKLIEMTRDSINYYDVGVRLSLELKSDSSFSANMFIPKTSGLLEEDANGDQTIIFDGNFKIKSDKLNFETNTDIYFRDADWIIDENKIYTNDIAYTILQKE